MIRDFTKDELGPGTNNNETELTIGGGLLLTLGGGLLLVCAVCFGAGYILGHRSSSVQTAALTTADPDSRVPAAGLGSKPGAARSQAQAPVDGATDDAGATGPVSAGPSGGDPSQAQVKPALSQSADSAQAATKVQPALTQVQGWMVQIAAVTHAEDAEVLVDALRKRGYSVTARRDMGDNLIHVQTGPFVNRNDANVMRQKLLNDGYNAVVQ
jgi:cell division septation protein DedD